MMVRATGKVPGTQIPDGLLGQRFLSSGETGKVITEYVSLRGDDEIFDRTTRAITAMAEQRHPNLVTLLDAGLMDDRLFFTIEAPPLGTLDVVSEQSVVVRAVADACRGLDALHRSGTFHRNIEPAQIGLWPKGARLGGFGLLDVVGPLQTFAIGPVGSTDTLAPALVHGASASIETDLYSMGATLHLALTAASIHTAPSHASLREALEWIATSEPELHPSLRHDHADAIARCVGLCDPQDRFTTAIELAHQLEEML